MKKDKTVILILLILILILFVIGIYIGYFSSFQDGVLSNDLILTCDSDEIKLYDEVICTLMGNVTSYEVSAFSSTIETFGSDFELVEVNVDEIWQGDGDGGDIDLYTDENKSGKFALVTFKVVLKDINQDEIVINLIDNSYFDEEYQEHNLENISKILKVKE